MPGEKNVGSVSVRVVPDTTGFKKKLEAELKKIGDVTVKVKLDIDRTKFDAELEKIRNTRVTIKADVDVDESALDKVSRDKLKPIEMPVQADLDKFIADIEKHVAGHAPKVKVKAEVDIDRDPFKEMLRGIGRDITSGIGSAFSAVGKFGAGAFGELTNGATNFSDAVSGAGGPLLKVGTALLQFAGYGFVIAEAGAAVTAAWGAASTAIAAVPAAIGLFAAPLAAVALGMDGIKKAAKTIEPQFKKLKSAVSSAFEKGLTPVLKTIGNELFPKLAVGLSATATALSGVATQLGDFVARGAGLGLLSTALGNINDAISRINLVPLVEGFLRLAGNNAALRVLTTTINEAGAALNSISLNPNLDAAFSGLEGILKSLTAGFGELVNNGINLFAKAAPGIQTAVDGIREFFGKFDYERLGTAVGNAFKGIGDALKSIPPATVEAITQAFEHLGTVLGGSNISGAIAAIVDQIPSLVNGLADALDAISDIVLKLDSLASAAAAAANGDFKLAGDLIANSFSDVSERVIRDVNGIPIGVEAAGTATKRETEKFNATFQKLATDLANEVPGAAAAAKTLGPAVETELIAAAAGIKQRAAEVSQGLRSGLSGLKIGVQDETGAIPGIAELNLRKLPGIAESAANKTVGLFGTGLGSLTPELQGQLGILPPVAQAEFDKLNPVASQGVQGMAAAIDAAVPGLGTAFATGFTGLGPLVDTAFAALTTANVATGLQGMATAITTGFPALIGTAFSQGFLTSVTPAVDQAFLALGVSVTMGMVNLGTAVTTGMTSIGLAFTTGFVSTVTPAVDQAFLALGVTVTMGMVNLGLAVTTGMTSISTAFTTGFVAIQASITTALVGIQASITTAMTGVTTAITTGMAQANTAIQSGTAQMAATLSTAGQGLVTNIKSTMDQFVQAVDQGGQKAVDALKKTGEQMKSAIPVNILVPVGEQISAGLAKGIASGGSAVTAAAVKVVEDAAAAANAAAQIKSPSRVWMKIGAFLDKGLALGIKSEADVVVAAVEAMMGTAAASVPQLSSALNDALSVNDFTAGVHQKIAVSGAPDITGGVTAGGDTYNFTTVPDATARQLADEVSFRRRTARRGVHAGR